MQRYGFDVGYRRIQFDERDIMRWIVVFVHDDLRCYAIYTICVVVVAAGEVAVLLLAKVDGYRFRRSPEVV